MSDILSRIAAYKRDEVAARRRARGRDAIEREPRRPPAPRGFRAALDQRACARAPGADRRDQEGLAVAQGLIRADFDPPALAQAYARGGAACLSVLTDGPSFLGADADLLAARAAVALPCLRKEFLLDPWQVAEVARAWAPTRFW